MVKVSAKIIGIKTPIEVKTTTRNIKAATRMMRDMAKVEADEDDRRENGVPDNIDAKYVMNMYDEQLKQAIQMTDFIKNMLRLTDKQADRLEDLEMSEVAKFTATIIRTVLRITVEDGEEDDQKSVGVETTV